MDKNTVMATTLGATGGIAGLPDIIDAVNYVATSLHMQPMQPSVVIGFLTIASLAVHALYMGRSGKPKAPAEPKPATPPAAVGALLAACLLGTFAVSACSSVNNQPWTPRQVAYFELVAAKASIDVGAQLEHQLPACAAQATKTAGQSLAAGVQAQVPVLTNGGSTKQQLETAGISGLLPLVNNLGAVLTACQGGGLPQSAAALQANLLTGGMDALQQLPALVGAVVEINGGWQPADTDLAAATSALQASTAKL